MGRWELSIELDLLAETTVDCYLLLEIAGEDECAAAVDDDAAAERGNADRYRHQIGLFEFGWSLGGGSAVVVAEELSIVGAAGVGVELVAGFGVAKWAIVEVIGIAAAAVARFERRPVLAAGQAGLGSVAG